MQVKLLLCVLIAFILLFFVPYCSLYKYIYVSCEKNNKAAQKVMKQFMKMVSRTKKIYAEEYRTIIIPFNSGDTPGLINMSTSFRNAPIVFKPVWGYHFARNPEAFKVAFMHSVGHELGHWTDIKKDPHFSKRPKEEKEFFLWVREIRNDFEGIKILEKHNPNVTHNQIIHAIECKANAPVIDLKAKKSKEKQFGCRNSYRDHPEWGVRLQMLACGQFSKDIIERIADIAECRNMDYIREVVELYFCE